MKSQTSLVLVIIGLLIALLFVTILAGELYTQHEAKAAIQEFKRLDIGQPAARSLSFLQHHRRHLVNNLCDSESCQYEFLFTNTVASKLHLAPRADIAFYLTLVRGTLDMAAIQYTSRVFKANSPIVWVQEDFCAERSDITCDYLALNPHGRDVSPSWNGIVEFGQLAPDAKKRAAWALNLECLAAHRGCKDISELLPAIWKRARAGTVTSVFVNSDPECRNCARAEP
jgi:hypothetical protein